MTKPLTYCRKRCRSNCEEETSEFMPLSKRINNLHINNTLLTNASVTVDSHHNNDGINMCQRVDQPHLLGIDTVDTSQWNGGLLNGGINHVISHNVVVNHNVNGEVNEERCNAQIQEQPPLPFYNPDLTQSQNPYYFENNRLLFNLYMERLQRNSSSNQL